MSATPSNARRPLLLAVAAVLAAGCGNDKGSNPVITPLPENSTPAGALALFEKSYEQQNLAAYAKLLTTDFHFQFSAQSDPTLAALYGTSWGPVDETASAGHLFDGFTSADPPYETFGPATSITMSLVGPQVLADSTHADSTAHYRVAIVPTVEVLITVVNSSIETTYEISSPHDLYLVRGDAAALGAGQPADTLHWYIRRWDDRSPAQVGVTSPTGQLVLERVMPTRNKSWGSIKDQYRR